MWISSLIVLTEGVAVLVSEWEIGGGMAAEKWLPENRLVALLDRRVARKSLRL